MKYQVLSQIVDFLNNNFSLLKLIKRVDNNTLRIEFENSFIIYCNITRGNSLIYSKSLNSDSKRDFNAPFDVVLQKRFINAKIEKIYLYNNDKIINIDVISKSSYKAQKTTLQLEFTGKNTNAIILDENRVVLEALRHIDEFSSTRYVKVGQKLGELEKIEFTSAQMKEIDVKSYLLDTYSDMEDKEIKNLKNQKISQISKKIKKIDKLLNSLESEEELELESKRLYNIANLILSNIYNIKPYQKEVVVINFEGNEEKIELNPKYPTPSSYSNYLFTQAKKAKQKASKLYLERDNLELKLEYFNRLIQNIDRCTCIDEIEFLLPKKEKNQTKTKKQEMFQSFYFKGYKILLGRDERENIYLLQNSRASDYWFHLKDRVSAHVIVPTSKKELPSEIIEKAAVLCAKFSLDFDGRIEVDYTQRRNVKIQNRANVLYNPYTTVVVNI